jgi:hypothetical protein
MKVGDLVKYYNSVYLDTQLIGVIVDSEEWTGTGGLIIWKVEGSDGTSIHFERHLEKIG